MRNKRIPWAALPAAAMPAVALLLVAPLFLTTGCGVISNRSRSYPNHATATNGGKLFVEPLLEVVDNSDLSDTEQRQALRDEFGIEDEDLIGALLTVPDN